jgi:hypothetical protein
MKDGLIMGFKNQRSVNQSMDEALDDRVYDVPDAAHAMMDTCRAGTHNTRHL